MTLVPLNLRPGIFKEASDLGVGKVNTWSDGNLVRFWKGQPQPRGGSQLETNPTGIRGVPRASVDWTAIDGKKYIGLGTHSKLYLIQGGMKYDITPQRASGTFPSPSNDNPFATTSGLSIVTVTHTSHGIGRTGTYVRYPAGPTVNSIDFDTDVQGDFAVTEIVDANTYKIETNQAASATSSGGGASVAFEYDIDAGTADATPGFGFGVGPYGDSTYGTPRVVPSNDLVLFPRTWALDTWGEDLIANPRAGGIYTWDKSGGTGTRATIISGAPTTAEFIIVSPQARILIAFGAHDGSASDPLLIRWCSQNDFTAWTPSETNTAGDVRLDKGSKILGAELTTSGDIAVFTDTAMYLMQYLGDENFIFSTHLAATESGIISPNASQAWSDLVFYMGIENFFVYDGRVSILDCDVESFVFEDINLLQRDKIFAAINRQWQEILWFYPTANSTEIDRFVAYNWKERTWNIGTLSRTVWADISEIFRTPYSFDSSGNLYTEERTHIFPDDAFVESGAVQLGEGEQLMYVNRIIPDFERLTGTVNLTLIGRKYPHGTDITKGPFAITNSTNKINPRIRSRQIKIKIDSDCTCDWRLSDLRVDTWPDGGR